MADTNSLTNISEKPRVLLACGKIEYQIRNYEPITSNYRLLSDKALLQDEILDKTLALRPEIIVFFEDLKKVNMSLTMLDILRKVRQQDVRVIFICSNRQIGDPIMDGLVRLGIYDIINRDQLPLEEIFDVMQKPKKFSTVSRYLGRIRISDDGTTSYTDFSDTSLSGASKESVAKDLLRSKREERAKLENEKNPKKGFFDKMLGL